MNELLFFHLPYCPHCKLALRCLDELKRENPAYAAIPVKMIDESREVALAYSYDYWYVPSFFNGRTKLWEGHAEKADVKRVLDDFLSAE